MKLDKCAKCGSSAIVQRVLVMDRTDAGEVQLQLRVDANPSAMVFKHSVHSGLRAFVCSACGFVEFYADNPGELYKAFNAAQHGT